MVGARPVVTEGTMYPFSWLPLHSAAWFGAVSGGGASLALESCGKNLSLSRSHRRRRSLHEEVEMGSSRKEFLLSAFGALAAAAGIGSLPGAAACGGGDDSSEPNGVGSCSPDIVSNHPTKHVLTVSKADIDAGAADAGVAKTYSIQGAADHDHEVTIIPAQFAKLKNGETIALTSTVAQAHEHPITVVCG